MIELKNLTKIYPSKDGPVVAVENIDLTIEDGAVYGIIGLSGAGKSTLVRCINLLERPTCGSVIVDGEDLVKVSRRRLLQVRRSIGMVFQSFNLLEQRTVAGNVRFPLEIAGYKGEETGKKVKGIAEKRRMKKQAIEQRVKELLSLVGLSDKANAYPSMLSGGQKQRVAIARALATRPKYLLCDEATSALDPNTTASILSLLKEINRELGVTIIVITHEMKVVESICTDVAVLDNSRIAEKGKVEDVFSFPKSEIAKELIIPDLIRSIGGGDGVKLRLVFNGEVSDAPIISSLAVECGVYANILYADTKSIDGKVYGHMVLLVPRESGAAAKAFLDAHRVLYREEA